MPNHEPLSRSGIRGRTGVPNDVLTYWIRYDLVRPIVAPSGVGRHLSFRWYEANIAAVMNHLRVLGVKIEGMLSIARVYRDAIAYFDGLGVNRDEVQALRSLLGLESIVANDFLRRARDRQLVNSPGFDREKASKIVENAAVTQEEDDEYWGKYFIDLGDERHGAQRLTQELVDVRERINADEFYKHLDAYDTITEQPKPNSPVYANTDEMTFFWRVGEGDEYSFAWGEKAGAQARQDGAVAMIAVDVTAVLHKVWNPEPSAPLAEAEAE